MWIPQVNQTVMKTVQSAGLHVNRVRSHTDTREKQRISFQLSSRHYVNLRGAIWDFSDSQVDEEDFQHLHGLVSCQMSSITIVLLMTF